MKKPCVYSSNIIIPIKSLKVYVFVEGKGQQSFSIILYTYMKNLYRFQRWKKWSNEIM